MHYQWDFSLSATTLAGTAEGTGRYAGALWLLAGNCRHADRACRWRRRARGLRCFIPLPAPLSRCSQYAGAYPAHLVLLAFPVLVGIQFSAHRRRAGINPAYRLATPRDFRAGLQSIERGQWGRAKA